MAGEFKPSRLRDRCDIHPFRDSASTPVIRLNNVRTTRPDYIIELITRIVVFSNSNRDVKLFPQSCMSLFEMWSNRLFKPEYPEFLIGISSSECLQLIKRTICIDHDTVGITQRGAYCLYATQIILQAAPANLDLDSRKSLLRGMYTMLNQRLISILEIPADHRICRH